MPTRDELIARKAEVQAHSRSLRPRLEVAAARAEHAKGVQRAFYSTRRLSLEAELDRLMAEEARLRVEIDLTPIRTTPG